MKTKLLHETDGKRTYAVVLSTGDEAMACLKAFAAHDATALKLHASPTRRELRERPGGLSAVRDGRVPE